MALENFASSVHQSPWQSLHNICVTNLELIGLEVNLWGGRERQMQVEILLRVVIGDVEWIVNV